MDRQTRDILKDFGIPTKAVLLPWVLEVTTGRKIFRVEVSKTVNQSAPWHADAYRKSGKGWKHISEFPWVDERSKESAIRSALDFMAPKNQIELRPRNP